ncbi:MAG: DUF748 domain-containing protein [Fibrobacter sp.]|nr:DUF748 domain-containing protein [Fibrobacter sp.]
MKKSVKIILIVVAALFVLAFAALKLAPGFVKDYIVAHSEEYIGRKVAIENVSLSPLTWTVNVDNFALLERDGTTPFVSFEKFRINLNPTRIITGTASVGEIYLKGLYVHVVQSGNRFNFSDILDKVAAMDSSATETADSTATDSTAMINAAEIAEGLPVSISVKNIALENGNIIYEDAKVGSKIHIKDFGVAIPAVYLSNKQTDVGVSLKFATGGDLNVKVTVNAATNDFDVNVGLKDFALAAGKPYLNDFVNIKDFDGKVSVDMDIQGNLNSILSSNVKGIVSVDSVVITETNDKTIGAKHVGVGISEANLDKFKFRIDSVVVDGAFAHLDLYKGGKTNIDVLLTPKSKAAKAKADNSTPDSTTVPLDSLITPAPEGSEQDSAKAKAEPAKKLDAIVAKLLVQNTTVTANDYTLSKPFNYKVSAITVSGSNINFDKPCNVNVTAAFPEGGSVSVKYKGALNDIGTMDAYVSVKNLALKHFSSYSLHFTGYPIIAGTMAFASDNKMNNFNVDSKNTIDIYNIDVGDKDDSVDPEYPVPMKVGLYVLKDKDDKIQFDVPVKGNVKDPEFSYLKIVWDTVTKLLIKVALSPIKIVGNVANTGASAVGLNLGKDDEILIDVSSNTFTSEQFAKASKMTEALAKDKNLTLTYTQYYNPARISKEHKAHKLKTEYYKQKEGKASLNEIDEKAALAIKDSDAGFKAYAKEHDAEFDSKAMQQDLANLAEKRNQELLNVLKQQKGVTAKNVKVQTAKGLNSYRGKPMYKVTVDVK